MTTIPSEQERRQHPRFAIRAYATLRHAESQWETHLLDMSMSGAKLALLDEHNLCGGDSVTLTVDIEGLSTEISQKVIHLRGSLIHLREHLLGVEYQPVSDIDRQLLTLFLSRTED
jgi:hypothetical protein